MDNTTGYVNGYWIDLSKVNLKRSDDWYAQEYKAVALDPVTSEPLGFAFSDWSNDRFAIPVRKLVNVTIQFTGERCEAYPPLSVKAPANAGDVVKVPAMTIDPIR